MAGGSGAVGLKGAADGVRGGQAWWFSGTARRGLAFARVCARARGEEGVQAGR